ncbi:hypothetical protein RYX36_012135, partial [Vicia faba]
MTLTCSQEFQLRDGRDHKVLLHQQHTWLIHKSNLGMMKDAILREPTNNQVFLVETPQHVSSPPRHCVDLQFHTSNDEDYDMKETNPQIGEKWPSTGAYGGRKYMSGTEISNSIHNLVDQMFYLYVRVVKVNDVLPRTITSSCDPYVEVKLVNYRGRTKHLKKKLNPDWNQVFTFSKDRIQSSILEVFVKDKEMIGRDDYLEKLIFDLNEIPTRGPLDSPLAPQWCFQHQIKGLCLSKTMYLRVNVVKAQDIISNDRNRLPEVSVKSQLGCQVLKTKICSIRTTNLLWNEDLVFVTVEPFENQLTLTMEDHVQTSKYEVLGKINLPFNLFDKILDHGPVNSRWFNLEKFGFGVLEGFLSYILDEVTLDIARVISNEMKRVALSNIRLRDRITCTLMYPSLIMGLCKKAKVHIPGDGHVTIEGEINDDLIERFCIRRQVDPAAGAIPVA